MKIECKCEEWNKYIDAMRVFYTLAHSHGIKYDGPQFKFCPFCGKWWGLTASVDFKYTQELLGEDVGE